MRGSYYFEDMPIGALCCNLDRISHELIGAEITGDTPVALVRWGTDNMSKQ